MKSRRIADVVVRLGLTHSCPSDAPVQLMPGVGPTSAQRVWNGMMGAADPIGTLAGAPSPPRAGAVCTAVVETVTDLYAGRAG